MLAHHAAAAVFLPSMQDPSEKTKTCVLDGFRAAIDFISLSLSGRISVVKLGVGGRGTAGSGCCISKKFLKVSEAVDWKYEWSGDLLAGGLVRRVWWWK